MRCAGPRRVVVAATALSLGRRCSEGQKWRRGGGGYPPLPLAAGFHQPHSALFLPAPPTSATSAPSRRALPRRPCRCHWGRGVWAPPRGVLARTLYGRSGPLPPLYLFPSPCARGSEPLRELAVHRRRRWCWCSGQQGQGRLWRRLLKGVEGRKRRRRRWLRVWPRRRRRLRWRAQAWRRCDRRGKGEPALGPAPNPHAPPFPPPALTPAFPERKGRRG